MDCAKSEIVCIVTAQALRGECHFLVPNKKVTKEVGLGSEGSAAGGRRSDLSEWQRSKKSRIVRYEDFFGYRNREYNKAYIDFKPPVNQGMLAPGKHGYWKIRCALQHSKTSPGPRRYLVCDRSVACHSEGA